MNTGNRFFQQTRVVKVMALQSMDVSKIADRLLNALNSGSNVPATDSNPAESLFIECMGSDRTLTADTFEAYLTLLNNRNDGTFQTLATQKTGRISDAKGLFQTIKDAANIAMNSRSLFFKKAASFKVNNHKFFIPAKQDAIKIKALASTQFDKLNRTGSTDQFEKTRTDDDIPKYNNNADQFERKPPRKKIFSLECIPKSLHCKTEVLRKASGSNAGIELLRLFKTGLHEQALAFVKYVPANNINQAPFNGSMIPQPELIVLDSVSIRDTLMNSLVTTGRMDEHYVKNQEIVINTTTGAIMYRTETGPGLPDSISQLIDPKKNKRILAEMPLSTSDKSLANSILEQVAKLYPTNALEFIINSEFTLRIEPKATQLYTPDDALIEQLGPINAALLCNDIKRRDFHRYSSVLYRSIGISVQQSIQKPSLADYVQAAIAALTEVSFHSMFNDSKVSQPGGIVESPRSNTNNVSYYLMGRYRPSGRSMDITRFACWTFVDRLGYELSDHCQPGSAMTSQKNLTRFKSGTELIQKSVKNEWLKSTILLHRHALATEISDDNAKYYEMAEKYEAQVDAATDRVDKDLATQISKIKWR